MIWPTKRGTPAVATGIDTTATAAPPPPKPSAAPAAEAAPVVKVPPPKPAAIDTQRLDRYTELKVTLHQKLIERINLAALETMSREQVGRDIGDIVTDMLKEINHALNMTERRQLVEDILDELLGLGPLEPLLKDPTISDIMVNSATMVFIERRGKIEEVGTRFANDAHLLRIIGKMVSRVGRRVDESSPMVDARLADGSRINAIIPPLALDGPVLSIRKFSKTPIDMDKLVGLGSMPASCAEVLRGVVASRRNVLIAGGTGSGKTTMLNAMSASIDSHERVVTIEDSAELQLQQRHVVRLETRPANIEGRGEVNQRDLVKNALRMRPDRVILGEIRSGEAFDMLQAMNTGHDGSMTTVHANTPRDALSRVEQMIGMSGIDISPKSARAQIASAIHVVLQLERLSDGRRKLTSIAEVTGMEGEIILMQEIFKFVREGLGPNGEVLGEMRPMGIRPKFMEVLNARGINLPSSLFDPYRAKTPPA
ncbi:MAG: type II secretion system protein E [Alphaproteobacteria bacterium]|nr:MAG: type II secretion system protein E [Alphaproteobacteria bacterium]